MGNKVHKDNWNVSCSHVVASQKTIYISMLLIIKTNNNIFYKKNIRKSVETLKNIKNNTRKKIVFK